MNGHDGTPTKINRAALIGATYMVIAGALFALNNTLAQMATMQRGMAPRRLSRSGNILSDLFLRFPGS